MNELGRQAGTTVERAISSLERLAVEAPSSSELAARWRDFEGRLLSQLREDERKLLPLLAHPSEVPRVQQSLAEHERLRNLAWEVALTTDLGCVHVRAISRLAVLLRERAQRSQRPDCAASVSG